MAEAKPLIIACIPAYNEEKTISKVILQTKKYVDKIVVCDDGSLDMTGELAEGLGAEVIRHERNMGYGAALASLFRRAREINADVMVTLDADCQHFPSDIPRIVEAMLKDGSDIMISSRFLGEDSEEMPRYRKIGINAITKLVNNSSLEGITDSQCGFRAYNRKAIQLVMPMEQGMGASVETLLKANEMGLKIGEIPIKINYDVEKTSSHNPFYHGVDVILSIVKYLSIKHTLLFYGVPGLVATLVGLVFWIWTFQIFAMTRQVVTNIALVAIGTTIVGLMFLTTAVILWVLISIVKEAK